jgi:hypothetical protein
MRNNKPISITIIAITANAPTLMPALKIPAMASQELNVRVISNKVRLKIEFFIETIVLD